MQLAAIASQRRTTIGEPSGCHSCARPNPVTKASHRLGRRRFVRPVLAIGPLERQICARSASLCMGRLDMWTPAHASKAARANQLPVSLSAKRTVAWRQTARHHVRRYFQQGSASWQGQFQGQNGDKPVPRKSERVVYLGFSPR